MGTSASALRKYQNWEAGKHLPGHEQLERIAEVLRVSYDYLVTGGEQAPPVKDILRRLDKIEEGIARLSEAAGLPTAPPEAEGDPEKAGEKLAEAKRLREQGGEDAATGS